VQVDLGGLDLLMAPNQSAITVVSTPACRSRIAAVCLGTCGVTFLARIDEQRSAAAAACLVRRCSSASRLSARPWLVGNTGSCGRPSRSVSQARSILVVVLVSGVILCFRPLPRSSMPTTTTQSC